MAVSSRSTTAFFKTTHARGMHRSRSRRHCIAARPFAVHAREGLEWGRVLPSPDLQPNGSYLALSFPKLTVCFRPAPANSRERRLFPLRARISVIEANHRPACKQTSAWPRRCVACAPKRKSTRRWRMSVPIRKGKRSSMQDDRLPVSRTAIDGGASDRRNARMPSARAGGGRPSQGSTAPSATADRLVRE